MIGPKTRFLTVLLLAACHVRLPTAHSAQRSQNCAEALGLPAYPREIDPARTFDSLVQWVHDEIIVKRGAPGLLVGISGTDSILAFLACAKAFEMAGKPGRAVGIHYGPSEDFIDDHPEARGHLWFQEEVIPWLRQKAPNAQILVDSSIDWRRDGLRWGHLMDWSVSDPETRKMREPKNRFWVVGTRNATEEALFNYSNISAAASVQVLNHLWKSEVLQIAGYVGAPEVALDKSCEVDCACGRMSLPARNIPEVDALIMARQGKVSEDYVKKSIPPELRIRLEQFIDEQVAAANFKKNIPLKTEDSVVHETRALDPAAVAAAKSDVKALSRLIPEVIAKGQANAAVDLFFSAPTPEKLALFNTPGLRPGQRKQMVASFFGGLPRGLNPTAADELAELNARIGNYGFTFPQWRFLTQKFGGQPALAEQFGMQALDRATDVRDASMDPSDPARDELGRGFAWQDQSMYIEYRRAYILVSSRNAAEPATLVLRNNSHYFGRDRLKEAVYFSLDPRSVNELQDLTAGELENPGRYMRWQDSLRASPEVPGEGKIKRASRLLDALDKLNLDMGQWMKKSGPHGGAEALLKFFDSKLSSSGGEPPLYLGTIKSGTPSWHPRSIKPLTPGLVSELRKSFNLGDFVMMTGANGDLP